MKKYLLLALASFAIVACSEDKDPVPAAAASFSVSRNVVEPGEPITITNNSTNATRYEWRSSDNPGQVNTTSAPVASFAAVGNYTITLTAYNSENVPTTSSTAIRVGNRYVKTVRLTKLNFLRANGTSWDATDGPDVYFKLEKNGATGALTGNPIADLTPALLPVAWNAATANTQMSNGTYTLAFWDKNSVLSDTFMNGWTWTVTGPPANRDDSGNSSETFTTPDAQWNVVVEMETR